LSTVFTPFSGSSRRLIGITCVSPFGSILAEIVQMLKRIESALRVVDCPLGSILAEIVQMFERIESALGICGSPVGSILAKIVQMLKGIEGMRRLLPGSAP
jgi:hypothetical protein